MQNKTDGVKTKLAQARQKRREKTEKIKSDIKQKIAAKTAAPNTVTQNRLELLITIVNRSKGEYFTDLLHSFDVNMQFVALGHGTADANMLSLFGLNDSEKAVIFSIISEDKAQDALHTLGEKFASIKNGKGIAYTVPLTSVIGTLIFGFLSNNRKAVKENKQ
ncbi:MAG: hypothetical protein NC184_07585 [Roseburia sp.]|nr:hypothetical protein [Roseburia sp.]